MLCNFQYETPLGQIKENKMSDLKFVKAEKILLSNHQSYNERWVQKHIAADPLGTENGGG